MSKLSRKIWRAYCNGNLKSKALEYLETKRPRIEIITDPRISELQMRNKHLQIFRNMYKNQNFHQREYSEYTHMSGNEYVYTLWLQGEKNAPSIVKACINSMRQNIKNHSVIVLDSSTILNQITLPGYIVDKWKKGTIINAHFSDIVRNELLLEYGGTWVDSTVYVSGNDMPSCFFDSPLFVFKDLHSPNTVLSNWFITACEGNNILRATQQMLFDYWSEETQPVFDYFMYHMLFTIATEHFNDEWKAVPTFSNETEHILQSELDSVYDEKRYMDIIHMTNIHKLTYKLTDQQKKKPNTYYRWIINNVK